MDERDLDTIDALVQDVAYLNESELFNQLVHSENHSFLDMLAANEKYVKEMSNYVPLLNIGVTMENGYYEPAYTFEDQLGHYTIDGIKESLKEFKK